MVRRGALCRGTQGPGDASTSPSPPGAGRSQERILPRASRGGLALAGPSFWTFAPQNSGRMNAIASIHGVRGDCYSNQRKKNWCSDVSADSQAGGGASRGPDAPPCGERPHVPQPRGGSLPDVSGEARAAAEAGAGAAGGEGAGGRRVWGRSSFTLPLRWEIAGGFSAQG